MKTYNYGETPPDVILKALESQCPAGYQIETPWGSEDFGALKVAVNQGIDAHLQGVVGMETFVGDFGKVGFRFPPSDMAVVIRRLGESVTDEARDLRSAILTTLHIEEV